MASSEVDQKFLARAAKAVENDNPLLSTMLFKILGLSLGLSENLADAKRERRPKMELSPTTLRRVLHILWLSREGLKMLEQYVIPMVGNQTELKVLAYKLRASFNHIYVLFHNNPPVSNWASLTPEMLAAATPPRSAKGKEPEVDVDMPSRSSSVQPTHPLEGGPIGPPPGFEIDVSTLNPAALLKSKNYLPEARHYFEEALALADQHLWGSHSLRLSVRTEYAAFLYECEHDAERSRQVAKKTIAEAYSAEEGMTDDMFKDTCELVTVLGKMMKRGLAAQGQSRKAPSMTPKATPPLGMENAI